MSKRDEIVIEYRKTIDDFRHKLNELDNKFGMYVEIEVRNYD